MTTTRTTVSALLCLLWAAAAHGQIVNVLPAAQSTADGWSGSLEGAADVRAGNTEFTKARLTGAIARRTESSLWLGIARGERGSRSDDRFIARAFGHLRYRQAIRRPIAVEGFLQVEADEFRRLSLRALAGGGLRCECPVGSRLSTAFGVALMAEEERLRVGDAADSGRRQASARVSSYVSAEWASDGPAAVTHTSFAQPRLTDLRDIRILSETTLDMRVIERVSIPVALLVLYDGRPPEDVEELDVSLTVSVRVRFE